MQALLQGYECSQDLFANLDRSPMKKILILFCAAAIMTAGFSSCQKCSTCTVQGKVYPEECGSKDELDAYESVYKAAEINGATVTCVRK
jgi:hypothetical protein